MNEKFSITHNEIEQNKCMYIHRMNGITYCQATDILFNPYQKEERNIKASTGILSCHSSYRYIYQSNVNS